jgi:ABC-type multidrug transport system fused ATPase/permease subunit
MNMKTKGWSMRRAHSRRSGKRHISGERHEAFARILLVVLVLLFVGLSPSWLASVVLCPFRQLTGLPCPGCGMTRALNTLIHGHWELALSLHPLSPIVAVGIVLFGISAVLTGCLPPQARLHRWSLLGERILMRPGFLYLLLALVLGSWIGRILTAFTSGEASKLLHQGWLGRVLSV